MKISTAVKEASFILREAGIDRARQDAIAIATWILAVEHLVMAPDTFTSEQHRRFMVAIGARARHIPLQHIVGTMNFRYLQLRSEPGVFVVRPETEYMVEEAVCSLRALQKDLGGRKPCDYVDSKISRPDTSRIATGSDGQLRDNEADLGRLNLLDLCTGSGAIALSLGTELDNVDVTGVDISSAAIDLALRNKEVIGGQDVLKNNTIQFEMADIRRPENTKFIAQQYHAVISNPPYVPAGDVRQIEALADPYEALYGGGIDGLAMPRVVAHLAMELLYPHGLFFMEHDRNQAPALIDILDDIGFCMIESHMDPSERPRWIKAQKPR